MLLFEFGLPSRRGWTHTFCEEMKTFSKYTLAFAMGAAAATFVFSIFIPGTVQRNRGFWGSGGPDWTQDAFETINSELPQLVNNPHLTFAITPVDSGSGYDITGFDTRLIARFGLTNWDIPIAKINSRMDALLELNKKHNSKDSFE